MLRGTESMSEAALAPAPVDGPTRLRADMACTRASVRLDSWKEASLDTHSPLFSFELKTHAARLHQWFEGSSIDLGSSRPHDPAI